MRCEGAVALTDQELEGAFTAHHAYLLRYCLRRVRDLETAEDLVGQTWLTAVRHRATPLDDVGALRPWLVQIARSRCIDYQRSRYARTTVPLPALEQASWSDTPAFEDGVLGTMDTTARDVLGALPAHYRALLVRRYLVGEAPEQMAAQLGVSPIALRSMLYRALRCARGVAARRLGTGVWDGG